VGIKSGASLQTPIERVSETDVQAMGKEMAATKFPRVANQFIERESDRRIVGSDNCASARADDDIDGNVVFDKLLKDPEVTCAAQASTAENHRNADCRSGIASMERLEHWIKTPVDELTIHVVASSGASSKTRGLRN